MGLKFPEDLGAWRSWAEKQNLLRYLKNRTGRSGNPDPTRLVVASSRNLPAQVVVAFEQETPTQVASLLLPVHYLEKRNIPVAVIAPVSAELFLAEQGFAYQRQLDSTEQLPWELQQVQEVIAVGHYLPVGEWAYAQADRCGWGFNVVQHGLNTPFVPPLPHRCTLFAFSESDAEFWISGREDIEAAVVGSQLFYGADSRSSASPQDIEQPPLFLGQMHGAELSRASFAYASYRFIKDHGAVYRPHPAEKDKLSLLIHSLWAKIGIAIDRSGSPLNQMNNPVVSIFSTGVLEAAIHGLPAWVYHPNPPAWLIEFWDRYGMSRWGSSPTLPPTQPTVEPAQKITQIIAHKLEN